MTLDRSERTLTLPRCKEEQQKYDYTRLMKFRRPSKGPGRGWRVEPGRLRQFRRPSRGPGRLRPNKNP